MKNIDPTKTSKIISVAGARYIDLLVFDLLGKAFDYSDRTGRVEKAFQKSILENTHATAGIVLTSLAIEAYRNRIQYFRHRHPGDVARDIFSALSSKQRKIQSTNLETLLQEIFIVRDAIAHNHLYSVIIYHDKYYNMVGHRQRLLGGYGDRKFRTLVSRNRKTRTLGLNVQPIKIGFEDLYKTLMIFDLLIALCQQILGYGKTPMIVHYKLNGQHVDNTSRLLGYYFDRMIESAAKKNCSFSHTNCGKIIVL